MSAPPYSEHHRVAALAQQFREELTSAVEAPLWSLSAAEAGDTLVRLTQARGQLDELLMRVLRHATTAGTGAGRRCAMVDRLPVIEAALTRLFATVAQD